MTTPPRLSGFSHRLAGRLVDWVITAMLFLVLSSLLASIATLLHARRLGPLVWGIWLTAGLAYYVWGWGSGQTVGCRLARVRLVDENTGAAPGFGKALTRCVVVGVLWLALVPLLLGGLWMLWDAKKQTWQDKVAGTLVIDG